MHVLGEGSRTHDPSSLLRNCLSNSRALTFNKVSKKSAKCQKCSTRLHARHFFQRIFTPQCRPVTSIEMLKMLAPRARNNVSLEFSENLCNCAFSQISRLRCDFTKHISICNIVSLFSTSTNRLGFRGLTVKAHDAQSGHAGFDSR